jgi:pantothenate synthetase
MSQLDQFLNYLSALNESTAYLTKEDYQKICAIRDRVTELAVKVTQSQIQTNTVTSIVKEKSTVAYQPVNETIIPLSKYFKSN